MASVTRPPITPAEMRTLIVDALEGHVGRDLTEIDPDPGAGADLVVYDAEGVAWDVTLSKSIRRLCRECEGAKTFPDPHPAEPRIRFVHDCITCMGYGWVPVQSAPDETRVRVDELHAYQPAHKSGPTEETS